MRVLIEHDFLGRSFLIKALTGHLIDMQTRSYGVPTTLHASTLLPRIDLKSASWLWMKARPSLTIWTSTPILISISQGYRTKNYYAG